MTELLRYLTPWSWAFTVLDLLPYIAGALIGISLRVACMICSTKIKRIITQQEK